MKTLKTTQNSAPDLSSEKGQASLEVVPLLAIFMLFVGYGVGAFGIVHTGILHNIAARNYAFETFRHRANVVYFRENRNDEVDPEHYRDFQIRLHAISHERSAGQYVFATERPISFGFNNDLVGRSPQTHNQTVNAIQAGRRAQRNSAVNPAWIKVQYGICINAECGNSGGT